MRVFQFLIKGYLHNN